MAEPVGLVRREPHLDFSCRGPVSLDFGMNISGDRAIEVRKIQISLDLASRTRFLLGLISY